MPDDKFPPGTPEFSANLLSYDEAIKQIIRKPMDASKGAEIEEIRKGIRVLDALDKAENGVLTLEDSDWEHLKAKTEAMQWAFVDRRIARLVDDILNATDEVTLNATEERANGLAKVVA